MRFFRTIRAVLREVFDETSYERYCTREGVAVNRKSYATFLRETEQARQQKVRCC